jgi:hypothetical protein
MKLVTFSRNQAPHVAGESRLVPDDVAADLARKKLLSSSTDWPPPAEIARVPEAPVRPILKPARPIGTADRRAAR